MAFKPERNQKFFVILDFLTHMKGNPEKFILHETQVIVVIGKDDRVITLAFDAALEICEINAATFQKTNFYNCIPEGKAEFIFSDFLLCDVEEACVRVKGNFAKVSTYAAQGISMEHPSENEELYLESSSSTRSKRIKLCYLKELHHPAPNTDLEAKRVKCEELILASTPLFNPYESLLNFLILLANKMYQSLGPLRNSQDAVVEVYYDRNIVEKLAAPLLEIHGWECILDGGLTTSGSFKFATTSRSILQHSFARSELLPSMVDPTSRISFTKSDSIFQLMKDASGTYYRAACNPRDASIKKKTLLLFARNEIGRQAFPAKQTFTKCLLAKKIIDHRIKSKKFLGFKSLTKVVVTNDAPFVLEIKPSSCGRSLVRMSFKVEHFAFKVTKKRSRGIWCTRVW